MAKAEDSSRPRRSSRRSSGCARRRSHAGDEQAVERQRERGQAPRPRAAREAARPGQLRRARPLRPPPQPALRDDGAPTLGRRRRHRLRDDLRPQGLRLLAGLHRLRRHAVGGVRREDLQGHGPRAQVRLPADRHQRLGRRAHPGGRRLAGRLRGDLLAQRAGLRRDPADQPDHGAVRRRRRLLAGDDRLRAHGQGDARTCSSPAPRS